MWLSERPYHICEWSVAHRRSSWAGAPPDLGSCAARSRDLGHAGARPLRPIAAGEPAASRPHTGTVRFSASPIIENLLRAQCTMPDGSFTSALVTGSERARRVRHPVRMRTMDGPAPSFRPQLLQ